MIVNGSSFKNKAKDKKIKLFSGVRTKFSASKLGNFLAKRKMEKHLYNENQLENSITDYNAACNNFAQAQAQNNLEAMRMAEGQIEINKIKIKKYREKVFKDSEILEYEAANVWDYYPQITDKEIEKLQSYYDEDTRTFKIGGIEIDTNVSEDKKQEVYFELISNFRKMEATDNMQIARSFEELGIATWGEDFIRHYSSQDNQTQETLNDCLTKVFMSATAQIGTLGMNKVKDMPSKEKLEYLSSLNLPNLKSLMETTEKSEEELPKEIEKQEETTKPIEKDEDTLAMEEYEYTLAIKELREKQDEIRTKIEKLRMNYLSKSEELAEGLDVWHGDVKYDNYNELAKDCAPLNEELAKAEQEERKAREALRLVKIEMEKNRIRKIKEKHRLQEAKDYLSKLQVGTNKYDTSKWSDEEILATYDNISSSMINAERKAKAREEENTLEISQAESTVDNTKDNIVQRLMIEEGFTEEQAHAILESDNQALQNIIKEMSAPQVETGGRTK